MKKDRFLWSAHRITERQKAGKARSIKGKQLKNSRSTVSKQHVALRSSRSAKRYVIYAMYWKAPILGAFSFFDPCSVISLRNRVAPNAMKRLCCCLMPLRSACVHLLPRLMSAWSLKGSGRRAVLLARNPS